MSDEELMELATRILRLDLDPESSVLVFAVCHECGGVLRERPEPVLVLH